ncbi:MAG: hypothetical protein IKT30_06865 [Bacteroidaceae bacterium]|nr:hypothetical protein [Bacteroidaceae bacterium]
MAETYHIFNWKELPPSLVATLSVGLSNDSRIKRKIIKQKVEFRDLLLALLIDGVNTLIWQNSKDGAKNRNRPESLFKKFTEENKPKEELEVFGSTEAFELWYRSKRE